MSNNNYDSPEDVMDTYDSRLEALETIVQRTSEGIARLNERIDDLNATIELQYKGFETGLSATDDAMMRVVLELGATQKKVDKLTPEEHTVVPIKDAKRHDCQAGFKRVGVGRREGYNNRILCLECNHAFNHNSLTGSVAGDPDVCPRCKQKVKY